MDSPRAVFVCVCIAVTQCIAFGVSFAFPVYLHTLTRHFGASQSTLALARSFVPSFGAVATNVATAAMARPSIGPRGVLCTCGVFLLLAMELTPFTADSGGVAAFIVTYAVMMGLSMSCLTAPGLAVAAAWWTTRQPAPRRPQAQVRQRHPRRRPPAAAPRAAASGPA
jgi:hypothetical protein